MSRPDEGLIHTWLDGECSADEAAHVERMVATDPDWAAAVAEARGLMAASSRIVSALDAVPARVLPAGSKAAPGAEKIAPASPELPARNGFRVRPWMKMAAGVVLVAGTAFAIRETTREVFAPVPAGTPEVTREAVAAVADSRAEGLPSAVTPPPAPVPVSPADRESSVAKATATRAGQSSGPAGAAPSVPANVPTSVPPSAAANVAAPVAKTAAPAPAPAAVAGATGRLGEAAPQDASPAARAARFEAMQRRLQGTPLSQVVTTGTRGAEPERILDSPNSIAAVTRLDGCWSITAPDSLRTVLRYPSYTRGDADSLVVEFVLGTTRFATVLQNGDALRGEITAKRVECPKP